MVRGVRALSRACALTQPSSLLRGLDATPQTALGSLLRARALFTIRPSEAHKTTGTSGHFPSGAGRGYGVMAMVATCSTLVAYVIDPVVAECEEDDTLPESIDWTENGVVTSVKKQGNCSNCYAHATVASIESLHKIKTGTLLDLSVQQVTDCAPGCSGCKGGHSYMALFYVASVGLSLDSSYPRRLDLWSGVCCEELIDPAVRIQGFGTTDWTEEDLMRAVAKQPVVVILEIPEKDDFFDSYKGGIIDHGDIPTIWTGDGKRDKHSVLIVGYGTDEVSGIPYWKIKNSYGTEWGENGYFRLRRFDSSRLGPACIRGGPGLYPLYDCNDEKGKIYGRTTQLEELAKKHFDPLS